MRLFLLCCLLLSLGAEDAVLAQRADGSAIRSGDRVIADTQTVLTLPGTTRSEVILAAGSSATFVADAGELRIDLDVGTIQVDVEGLGPWQGLRVRGASAEVTVTGTLFVVARDRRGVDTVGLVRGAVQLRLRREIVAALGQDPAIDLSDRQQVSAGPDGFSPITTLSLTLLESPVAPAEDGGTEVVADAIMDGMLDDAVGKSASASDAITDTVGGVIGLPPSPPD